MSETSSETASQTIKERGPLSEETCVQFAALTLLDRVITQPEAYHAALLEEENSLLEANFDFMMKEDLVTVGEDDHFQPTDKGRKAYQTMLQQQQSYLAHFDIYSAVDMADGRFGDAETDDLGAPNWSDLRIAVGEYKGVDPYRMVFLSMLADGSFFDNPNWKFDLVLGSSFFKEMEEIVRSQIRIGELAYQDEDGSHISGERVMEDVILQGAQVNQERIQREKERQASLFEEEQENERRRDEEDDDEYDEVVYVPYDPWGPAGAYMGSAMFIEAMWLSSYW